jgi:pilus assembly protein CpaE
VQGIADALATPERLDEMLLDRLLTKCSEHLSLFAAPVVLDRDYDLSPEACETVLDVVRQSVPYVTVDLPHLWTAWCKRILLQADEVVITAEPDLANLRNTKNIVELLKAARKNDASPRLVLNRVGMPKRPEITVKEFEQNVGLKATAVIEFDVERFGQAAINGRMIEELDTKAPAAQVFRTMAHVVTNRRETRTERKPSAAASAIGPLLEKFKIKI